MRGPVGAATSRPAPRKLFTRTSRCWRRCPGASASRSALRPRSRWCQERRIPFPIERADQSRGAGSQGDRSLHGDQPRIGAGPRRMSGDRPTSIAPFALIGSPAGSAVSRRLSQPVEFIARPGRPFSRLSWQSKCERLWNGTQAACTMAASPSAVVAAEIGSDGCRPKKLLSRMVSDAGDGEASRACWRTADRRTARQWSGRPCRRAEPRSPGAGRSAAASASRGRNAQENRPAVTPSMPRRESSSCDSAQPSQAARCRRCSARIDRMIVGHGLLSPLKLGACEQDCEGVGGLARPGDPLTCRRRQVRPIKSLGEGRDRPL